MPARAPQLMQVGVGRDPPDEVRDRERDGPDRELADEAPNEADRPQQRKHGRDGAEDELPEPDGVEAERPVGEGRRRGRDDDQLEDRPAEALQHVEPGREVGAAPAERRPLEHHRRHARVGADQRGDAEHRAADHAAEHRREERLLQRQAQVRRRDENEDRDAEVRPEQERVGRSQDAQPLRYRLDSPIRSLHRGAGQPTNGAVTGCARARRAGAA